MCGLVGVFGEIGKKEKQVMKSLLLFDTVRGEHSTGLLVVDKGDQTRVLKALETPENLYREVPEEFENGIIKGEVKLLMGHNRFATQGGISLETAHPFEFDSIIGAHNGTVVKWSIKGFHEANKYDVDSQILFSQIDEDGHAEKVFEEADGAFALTWWDKDSNELNFARNAERTLYKCTSKGCKTLFWASESWMLNVALGRAGIEHDEIVSVKTLENQVFDIDEAGVVNTRIYVLPKKKVVQYYPKVVPTTPNIFVGKKVEIEEYVPGGDKDYTGHFFGTTEDGRDIIVNTIGVKQEEHYKLILANSRLGINIYDFSANVMYGPPNKLSVHFVCCKPAQEQGVVLSKQKTIQSFNKKLISYEDYSKVINAGCAWCGLDIPHKQIDAIEWVGPFDVYCPVCKHDAEAKKYSTSFSRRN